MVYCGKPSRGCQMCRTRRIKCDETKPTCNQCARSRRQCPGYKDEFDLVFRNETQATERRARKASRKTSVQKATKPRLGEASSSSSMPSTTASLDGTKEPLEQAVVPAPSLPVEQRATCYFVSNFILMSKPGCNRGFLEYLIPLLRQDNRESHLQHAFNSCALALLHNRGGPGSKLGEMALGEYSRALAYTNTALRDPRAQKEDSTLAAVLLLGMFENITAKQIETRAWRSHIEGAIQLVKMRGKKQLRTRTGLLLFVAVRTQMIIHSLSSAKAPGMDLEWWLEDAVINPQAAQCQRVCIKVGELRAEANRLLGLLRRTPEGIGAVLDLIRRCQEADREAVAWAEALPDYWRPRTAAWEDHVPGGDHAQAEVFPGRVDLYTDLYIGSVWNMVRTSRLIAHSLIVRCAAWVCAPVDYRTTPEYATAARTCVAIITDIIAGVPYHLGWRPRRGSQNVVQHNRRQHPGFSSTEADATEKPEFACGEEETASAKALAGDFITWPLVCVSTQDYTTDAQRAWVRGRLRYIGDEIGIKYAHVLNDLPLRVPSMLIRHDAFAAATAHGSGHASGSGSGLSPAVAAHFTACRMPSPSTAGTTTISTSQPSSFPATPWPTAATTIAVDLKRLQEQQQQQGQHREALEEPRADLGCEQEEEEEEGETDRPDAEKGERRASAGNATRYLLAS